MKRIGWILAVAVLATMAPAMPAHAWIITQTSPPDANVTGSAWVNIDHTSTADVFDIFKFFGTNNNGAPLVLSFVREAGDKNFLDLEEFMWNQETSPSHTWTAFSEVLSSGVLFADANAVAAQQFGGASRLGGTPVLSSDSRALGWSNASQPVAPASGFGIANQLVLSGLSIDASGVAVGGSFTLTELSAFVPEPATLGLIVVGGIALVLRRRRAGARRTAETSSRSPKATQGGSMFLRGLMVVGLGLLLLAGSSSAATISQASPAGNVASADWNISYVGGNIMVGLEANYMTPAQINSPILLLFMLDANDSALLSTGGKIELVNIGNTSDSNVTMHNSMTDVWRDFHVSVVNLTGFISANASLDNPAAVGNNQFATVSSDPLRLDFSGGTVPVGGAVNFSGIDINATGPANAFLPPTMFIVQLIPTPEPGTICLVTAGVLWLVRSRRK
jgi:hypothetical protein